MASSVIHIAVANEVNKVINVNRNLLLIGAIAPDPAKLCGETKSKSHFLDSEETDIPNLNKFIAKYKDKMDNSYVIGYYIHLYTDYLWFKYFISEIIDDNNNVLRIDGINEKITDDIKELYVYSDYSSLSAKVLDMYNLDLKVFYNELPEIDTVIDEVSREGLSLLVEQGSVLIENSREEDLYLFDIDNISKFVDFSVKLIISSIKELCG